MNLKRDNFWNNLNKDETSNRRKKNILYVFLALAISFVIIHEPFLIAYGNWLSEESEDPSSDIVIPQGAGLYFAGDARLETAIKLFSEKKSTALITVALPERMLKDRLSEKSIDRSRVYFGECVSMTTFSDAIEIKKVLNQKILTPRIITLVTDKYVLRRFKWIVHRNLDTNIQIKTYASRYQNYNISKAFNSPKWWQDSITRDLVISETQKLIFYWLYYEVFNNHDVNDIPFDDVSEWLFGNGIKDTSYQRNRLLQKAQKFCSS